MEISQYKMIQVVFNGDFVGKNFAGTRIRTHDLPTWIFWDWVSAFLTAFSRLSDRSQVPQAGSHCPLEGHLVAAAGNLLQPEPELIQSVYIQLSSRLTALAYKLRFRARLRKASLQLKLRQFVIVFYTTENADLIIHS